MARLKCRRCEADPRPKHFGSDRNCAFNADGTFTDDNWNCATIEALMVDCEEFFGSDESIQIVKGEEHGGWIVLTRYKRRGKTSGAMLMGDYLPRPLTLALAEAWLDGSFWSEGLWDEEPR